MTGVPGRRQGLTLLAAIGAFALALVLSKLVLDARSFPASLRVDVGTAAERAVTWFTDECAWLYQPAVDLLDGAFEQLLRWLDLVPAPVLALALVVAVLCTAGWRLAGVTALTLAFVVSVDLWAETKETFALMAVAVAVSCAVGVAVGVAASLNRHVERAVQLVLDGMQAFPLFAYLVPMIVIFGPGQPAALVATIIWATPPLVRLTIVGIRDVAPEAIEAAVACGATRSQVLRGVVLPLARPGIRAGVNQTIMFAIAMAIVAAMIGAAGLGQPVWSSLNRLEFGQALEAGIVLVLLAIIADRLSSRPPRARSAGDRRRVRWLVGGGVVLAFAVVAESVRSLRLMDFGDPPAAMQISLRGSVDAAVDWVNLHLGSALGTLRDGIQLYGLNPLSDALAWVPWPAAVVAALLVGWATLGWRRAPFVAIAVLAIGALGMWAPTIDTLATAGVAVAIALALGIPLGIAMSRSDRLAALMRPVLDTLLTLPVFLFVIPAVVVLGSGSVAGVLATVCYAATPVIRLTNVGLRSADPATVEAATSFGATPWQVLRQVRLPLGLPTIMVGVNQTIMLALAMAVVSAFIGTPGLGEEILAAVSNADLAVGIEAGLAMFVLAVIIDRVVSGGVVRLRSARHLADA